MSDDGQSAVPAARPLSLEVRLARSPREVAEAQRLRYRVFYDEMSATMRGRSSHVRIDVDIYDSSADHLIVLDHAIVGGGAPEIVGTVRLLRRERARGNFYSSGEFDVGDMLARHRRRRFLELGRLCVLKQYRASRAFELMWRAALQYIRDHGRDVIFGCASIEGTEIDRLAPVLALLRRLAPAPEAWRVKAITGAGVPLDAFVAADADSDDRETLRALPPLIRAYLRLGAYVCEEAVVDWQFGTTDVFTVLPVEAIAERRERDWAGAMTTAGDQLLSPMPVSASSSARGAAGAAAGFGRLTMATSAGRSTRSPMA
jgi:L-ornithine Nalpha-acyltransferase